jgi:trehalose synthase
MSHLSEVDIKPKSHERFTAISGPEGVELIRRVAAVMRQRLEGRVIWNINTTAAGGGVAELLRSLLAYSQDLGVDARWVVISGTPEFFRLTKRLHHALHGEAGDGSDLGDAERKIYEEVLAWNAADLVKRVSPRDVVILHDPQTAGLAPHLKEKGATIIWRCHIGADTPSAQAALGWRFLAPYLPHAKACVFSRATYVPEMCDHGRSTIVAPSIDPFSAKNQDLDEATVRSILVQADLIAGPAPGEPTFARDDGTTARVERPAAMTRLGPPPDWETPLVVQVSRWDPLKDPVGVIDGFVRMRESELPAEAALVLAGPGGDSVSDDPEGLEVFERVLQRWKNLPEEHRRRVHLANLPTIDLQENAAIVNALQRHAAVVVQKSLREGFGLTVTEAMWKARPLIASAVGGIQDQIEHGVSGLLLRDPTDVDSFAALLGQVLHDPALAERLGREARARVTRDFLGLRSLLQFAELIGRVDS